MEKAVLVLHEKLILEGRLISERKIWRIKKSERYPHGFKYRMVLVDPEAREVLVLFDNHWPKGPHVHIKEDEKPYAFKGLEQLFNDFLAESGKAEKRRHDENKKNDR